LSFTIEDYAARCGNRQPAPALVLSDLGVSLASDNLQHVQTNAEHAKQGYDQHLDKAQASTKVLRCVFEFHW
jgi:hypothetical protein